MGLDDHGFETLFRRQYPRVFRFFLGRGFAAEAAEDLTQDVFERVYKGREGYRGEAEGAWVLRIAKNVWKNELRRKMAVKRDAVEVSIDLPADAAGRSAAPVLAETRSDPEATALGRVRRALVRAAIAELPAQGRRCAELRYLHGLKYREIAETLALSVGTVKSHLNRVKECLGRALATETALSGRPTGGDA